MLRIPQEPAQTVIALYYFILIYNGNGCTQWEHITEAYTGQPYAFNSLRDWIRYTRSLGWWCFWVSKELQCIVQRWNEVCGTASTRIPDTRYINIELDNGPMATLQLPPVESNILVKREESKGGVLTSHTDWHTRWNLEARRRIPYQVDPTLRFLTAAAAFTIVLGFSRMK